MDISLRVATFSAFKVFLGGGFLLLNLLFPIAAYISLIILIVGKAHSLGAWMAIWRAGKFNWTYFCYLFAIIAGVSFWGIKVAPLLVLAFFAHVLFTFHFLFDEFDLQQEKRNTSNVLASLNPFILISLFLINSFFYLNIQFSVFLTVAVTMLLIELLHLKRINWFTVQSKILTLYVLASIYVGVSSVALLNVFLAYHYLFWFIYPVYKLHKYKREERDGFIMMLLVIVAMSVFIYSARVWGSEGSDDIAVRTFYIATITHILTTAPFGYLIGLPKPKNHESS